MDRDRDKKSWNEKNYVLEEKKFWNRTRIRVYGFHSWLKLQPCFLIGEDY